MLTIKNVKEIMKKFNLDKNLKEEDFEKITETIQQCVYPVINLIAKEDWEEVEIPFDDYSWENHSISINDVRDLLEHLGFPVNYRFEESEEE